MTLYSVFEDILDPLTNEVVMRMHEELVEDVRTALVLLRKDKKYTGIAEKRDDGLLIEHPVYYFEELLEIQREKVKYPQHILAFDSLVVEKYFPGFKTSPVPLKSLDPLSYMNFMNENSMAIIARREELEHNEDYLQVLPYVVVRVDTPNGSKFLLYKRPDKGSGESRLAGQYSMGFGGHVDLFDIRSNESVIELHSTLGQSASREINEELLISRESVDHTDDFEIEFTALFLLDRSAPVHRVHIASIAVMVMQAATFDFFDIACRDEKASSNVFVGLYTAQELLHFLQDKTFSVEAWTQALILEIQNPKSLLCPYTDYNYLKMTLDGHDLGDQIPEED